MKSNWSFLFLLIIAAISLDSCSGVPRTSGGCTGSTCSGTGGLPVLFLTIQDTPPAGVTLLSFSGGAGLFDIVPQTGPVFNLNSGALIHQQDVTRLQSDSSLAVLASVPQGGYTGMQTDIGAIQFVILNQSSGAIGSCAVGTLCTFTVSSPGTTSTVPVAGMNLAKGLSYNLVLDLNLSKAIITGGTSGLTADFTQSGALTATVSTIGGTQPLIEDVLGIVGNVDTTKKTLQLGSFTQGIVVATVDTNTVFDNFPTSTCPSPGLSCLVTNQMVSVDYGLTASGTIRVNEINFEDQVADDEVEGIITGITDATHFRMVVQDKVEESTAGPIITTGEGEIVDVALLTSPTFVVDTKNLTSPAIPSAQLTGFQGASDTSVLTPGQVVQVRLKSVSSGSGGSGETISTDRVRLRFTRVTGTIAAAPASPTFNLGGFPSLFTPPSSTIQVQTFTQTAFDGTATNFASLASGDTVSLRALYFNPTLTPSLFAAKVRKH